MLQYKIKLLILCKFVDQSAFSSEIESVEYLNLDPSICLSSKRFIYFKELTHVVVGADKFKIHRESQKAGNSGRHQCCSFEEFHFSPEKLSFCS